MPNPTARSPIPEPQHASAWLLGPADLAAIHADDALIDRLGDGEQPDENDLDPVAAALAAWLVQVAGGDAR